MIENKKLRHFITLASVGNFNTAAELLHISQPALSRSIQTLESQLKLALFDRNQRAIKLTDAGRHLLERAQTVLLDVENLTLEAERYLSLQAGKLVVGTGPLAADHIGARACALFLNQYPQMRLRLIVNEPHAIIASLVKGEVDLLISDPRGIPDTTDLLIQPLPPIPGVVVARHHHPLASRKRLAFQDLMKFPRATISQLMGQNLAKAVGLKEPREIAAMFSYECNSVQLMLTTLMHSDAVGVLLTSNIQEELKRGDICILDVPAINYQAFSQYGITTYGPRLLSLAAEKFIEIVQGVAEA